MSDVYLGLDVGSTTVKFVVLGENGTLLSHQYLRSHGNPRQTVLDASRVLPEDFPTATICGVGLTGSGGERVQRLIGGFHANELVTQARAVGEYHPEARTVIEIGGQDSKFLSLEWDENSQQMVLVDFAMNALCAAGTGSFLDQQAERLGIEIDGEFARIALTADTPARIAGRCTVFAKSDMIHLAQEGAPQSEILAGLCLALARNFKTVIGKGKSFVPPILFQGGVAFNDAVTRAFEGVLRLEPGQLIVPEYRNHMASIGAALTVMDEQREGRSYPFNGFEPLEEDLRSGKAEERSLTPLSLPSNNGGGRGWKSILNGRQPAIPVYMGVDVGSLSTNVVLIDAYDRVLARRYLPTAGRPLEAVRRGLAEVDGEVGGRVRIVAVGATGSGRYLTGHYVGADVIRNEITSQARAAAAIDAEVDTIFEIGGQDSKYIRMHNGAVVDFAMNNACAAGTGSFLEEQADRLRVSIRDDFEQMAGGAPAPACLGERCTVFMESDLVHHQQRGATVENLTAGLAYSIVNNYLNRVVNKRPVGKRILFQGGVASNASVAAAFESVTGRPITVPEHNDVTGAIGAAILAREEMERRGPDARTTFRGFDLANYVYDSEVFVCRACPNLCEVKKVVIGDDPPIFSGTRCDRFEEAGRAKVGLHNTIPDLFAERAHILYAGYDDPGPRTPGRIRVGLPRALVFHDLFPYWRRFFEVLDIDLVLSDVTNPTIIRDTQRSAAAETCFPVKLMFGHVMDLLDRDLDYVFLPSIIDRENTAPGQTRNHYCPYIPASPHMVMAHIDIEKRGPRPITFPLHMMQTQSRRKELRPLASQLGMPIRRVMRAAEEGAGAQEDFYARIRRRGAEVLRHLGSGPQAVVIVGRPYNSCDPGVCQDLPLKLRKLGVLPVPMDFLPLESVDVSDVHQDMFWRSGQDILAAAKIIASDERMQAIYLTSFNCGPDSFIISYFRQMMGAKPFLALEVDDHTAEAGIVTRCEAFLDSLGVTVGVGS
jgi:predicted CoA-substrate-specific enzyme activase